MKYLKLFEDIDPFGEEDWDEEEDDIDYLLLNCQDNRNVIYSYYKVLLYNTTNKKELIDKYIEIRDHLKKFDCDVILFDLTAFARKLLKR